jgi:peptide/nickel transport system permease protein
VSEGLSRYLLRRFTTLLVTVVLVSALTFAVLRLLPGDTAEIIAGTEGDPAVIAHIRESMGLDRSVVIQFLDWLAGAVRGELGTSIRYGQPVMSLIAGRLPVTLALTLMATLLATLVAGPFGVYAAVHRNRGGDLAAMVFTQLGIAVPSFWVGIMLILLFAVYWSVFPAGGFTPWTEDAFAAMASLTLPALALALPQAAVLTRLVRSSMLEVLSQDYVRTARAKGLSEWMVIYGHALRNALIPPITVLGLQIGHLLAGSIVVENVFALPGLGQLILRGIAARDLPVVQGAVAFVAFVIVLVNFIVDLGYVLLDPRIRY